ncbi:TOPRIM nucleotidyl transferase/hydrolase domain-containing protein, partial [Lactiplantibacillus plantarum]|uniref:TOPRIM nucleotidyl transferase/hydrolase domain-containing protein n=1 Tax=Lactiplantibacillus plantarum TaxID=1590 RepID=UPI00372CEC90
MKEIRNGLYLHHLINTRDEFKELRQKYVAYVQVGGEYAFKLDTILEELGVKTLIISDVDYCK